MRPIIKAEHLSKRYQLGEQQGSYGTLRDTIVNTFRSPLKRIQRRNEAAESVLWALKDISFEVHPGEVVGIIGRNGAGKSTLLKLLSRITEPTTGRAEIFGRVGSLLEVGTGFHPELSGRENIFLNGSILGMSREEIARRFDEIVAFAEIEKFLDTPVKRYSSGMYMRLAFAVAAHLEPEILIVDEVLAVGDIRFQRKCLNKMQDVGQQGRTVLFISHSMAAITRLCQRAILLNEGQIIADGPSDRVVSTYLHSGLGAAAERAWPERSKAPGNEVARLRRVRVCTADGQTAEAIDIRQPVGLEMEFEVLQSGHVLVPNFGLYNEEGMLIFIAVDSDPAWRGRARTVGCHTSTAWVLGNFFAEGSLTVNAAVSTFDPVFVHAGEAEAVAFQVVDSMDGDSARGGFAGVMPGVIRPLLRWENKFSQDEAGAPEMSLATATPLS